MLQRRLMFIFIALFLFLTVSYFIYTGVHLDEGPI